MRIVAPAVVLSMMFTGIAMALTGDRQYLRLIPGFVVVLSMVPAWICTGKGRPKTGVTIIMLAICLAVFLGMVLSGGIRAPGYIATVACITMFIVLYGHWGGIFFGLAVIGAGVLFIWLDRMGLIRDAVPPSDLFYLIFIATYLVLQFCFVLIPVGLMYNALQESRSQGNALKKAVHDRKVSQRELESILNKTPDIIYRLDPEGRFTFISDAVRKYGHRPYTFMGKSIMEFVHPEDRDRARRKILERRSGKRGSTDLEVRLRMGFNGREDDWSAFLVSSEGLYDEASSRDRVFRGSQGIARDVSKTKRDESRIMTLAAVIEQAAEDVVITDPDGIIRYVNPRLETLTGYAKEEMMGRKTSLFKSGKHNQAFYADLWGTIKGGQTWNGKIWNRIRNGSLILQDVTITPILDKAGDVTGFASVRRDITEQDRLEEQLKQSRKMEAIGTLAGGIAHDFNNILGAILGYAELSLGELNPDDPVTLYTTQILKAGERAKDLVRQILLFSRQTNQEKQPVKVSSLAKEVIKLLKATLPADIEIRTRFQEESGLVLSDPAQIHQIFMNLGTNAAHAMREGGGTLIVAIEEGRIDRTDRPMVKDPAAASCLKITVKDTGTGIPEEIREKIFDPFFTTKSRDEGTGMGLAVVYGIVEDHGGTIQVDSAPGQGTAFTVILPVAASRAEKLPALNMDVPGGNEHILFVDDEPDLAELTRALLEKMGYKTSAFTDSRAAFQAFREDPDRFDLIITDMRMPGMSGMEMAKEAMALRPELPVIMCTGFSEPIAASQAHAIGIRVLLNKPVLSRELGEAIRRVLDPR